MHADYRLLKKQIMEERKNMSEQEFFTSDDYTNYQLGMARAATRRYYSNLNMQMGWDESPNANVACTNNKRIYENAANPLTRELPTWYLKSLSLTGLTGHECGRLLYTDFTSSILYGTSMKRGSFYPELPEAPDYPQNKTELLAAIADKKEVVCKTLARCAHSLCNVLEDVYIEARICQEFPGTFQLGIGLLNDQFAEQMPSIQQQIKDGYNGYSIMVNLIIQYCKAGDLNNVTGYSGEYLDYLDACIPYIENSMYDTDTRKRFSAVNEMLVILWEYIKPLIEEAEKQKDEQQAKKFLDNLDKTLSGQIASGAPLPDLTGGAKAASDVTVTGKALSAGKTAAESLMQEENDRISRIPLQETHTILDGNHPGVTWVHDYKGSQHENSANEILSMLTKLADDKVNKAYEDELTDELRRSLNQISYGNAHKGIHLYIHRISQVNQSLIAQYNRVKKPLLKISKRLQSNLIEVLEKRRNGEKLSHLPYGRRFESKYLYLNDGSYFSRNRLPNEAVDLSVALLVDQSGSMHRERIGMALQTAIILYDFCKGLGIPVTIYGHNEDIDAHVNLYSYAEFDCLDDKDCYRLMDMKAGGCNRDGAALRFVAEHLCERPEEMKLLFLISDGQPNGEGYGGTKAEEDLRGLKREYRKKGVILFAAAIGEDKERIKRIYQDGFLDITDLNKLPKLLPRMIEEYI